MPRTPQTGEPSAPTPPGCCGTRCSLQLQIRWPHGRAASPTDTVNDLSTLKCTPSTLGLCLARPKLISWAGRRPGVLGDNARVYVDQPSNHVEWTPWICVGEPMPALRARALCCLSSAHVLDARSVSFASLETFDLFKQMERGSYA